MKHTAQIISTYSCDTSGVGSALYELGGMTVMHDAGGYAGIYSTHDEPRWYEMDSMIFISGLTETQAILGDDSKFINDTIETAQRLHPKFIALGGSPIPMVVGTDFPALAREVEHATGIMTFGFDTNGMNSYISGDSLAFAELAKRVCKAEVPKSTTFSVNLLGVTPLDFSLNGTVQAMEKALTDRGVTIQSNWAMGGTLEDIEQAGAAHVNLVVSAGGLLAAKVLQKRFGIPYVIGIPYGKAFTDKLVAALHQAAETGTSTSLCQPHPDNKTIIIGESVNRLTLVNALYDATGVGATVLCPVDAAPELLSKGCIPACDEDELKPFFNEATTIIADPMYQPICPETARFISLPHEAFSGRVNHGKMRNLVTEFEDFQAEIQG